MDLNTYFLANHSEHFISSRKESYQRYFYGRSSFAPIAIAWMAAGTRRLASAIERWAKGANVDVVEYRLPKRPTAR